MSEFDHGPSASLAQHFDEVPDPPNKEDDFWFDWGPIFYRGRLDGSAKLLCIASDPGPTERIAGRTLVGDAGQRVQGFLAKLGLTHSYVCVNAWPYAFHPTHGKPSVEGSLKDEAQLKWRNKFYDAVAGPKLQVVVVFGYMARAAVNLWKVPDGVQRFDLPHPSNEDKAVLGPWRAAIPELRKHVSPDPDGSNTGPNYGASFEESDYAAVPRRDLPFGAPTFLGDDAWVREAPGSKRNSVGRPSEEDDGHTLIWKAPKA